VSTGCIKIISNTPQIVFVIQKTVLTTVFLPRNGGLVKMNKVLKFAGEIPAAILNCHTIVRNFRRRYRGSAYVSGVAL
jgi:hypothetical protein